MLLPLSLSLARAGRPQYSVSPDELEDLELWFKADAGVYTDAGSTAASDGEAVQQWNDQSGNNRNMVQLTASIKPTYKTGIINDLPVLRFDGGDYLQGTWNSINTPFHLFLVSQVSNTSQDQFSSYFASYGTSPPAKSFQLDFGASGEWRSLHTLNAGSGFAEPELGTPSTDVVIMELQGGSSGIQVRLDGVDGDSAADPTNGTFGNFAVGRNRGVSNFLTGDIAEVIVCSAELSASDAAGIRTYLTNRYKN